MDKYRIPKIEEFVEGFKFEVYMKSQGGSYFLMDNNDDYTSIQEQISVNRLPTVEEWKEFTVPKITLGLEWCFPFSVKYFLKQNKVRTKA